MAEFRTMVITSKGQALITKMLAGKGNIQFTKISLSETAYTDEQLSSIGSLSGVKQSTSVTKVTKTSNSAVQIEGAVTNSDLTKGYNIRTIALYAKDPDEGEIVYAACGASTPGWMPPYNGVSTSGCFLKLVTTVQNSSNVTIKIDPAAVATIGDIQALQTQITDIQAFLGYTDNDIYGVEVDFKNRKFTRLAGAASLTPGADFDNIEPWKRRRCNMTDSGEVIAYYGDAGYSETGALTQAITIGEGDSAKNYPVGTKVQVMVEQPKFYYKVVPLELEKIQGGKGFHMRKARYYISPIQKSGFKIHPAFVKNGKIKNFIYPSAFEGCLFDTSASAYITNDAQVADFAADKLSSIAGAKPASGLTQNLTRGNTRKLAANRGTGWSLKTVQAATATELLFLIEYAGFNMQSAIGMGNTTKTDDGKTSMTEPTGFTSNLGNGTGVAITTDGFQVVTYRGEENPYGNIWDWIDGLNHYKQSIFIADHDFKDDTGDSPYSDAGITASYSGGFVSAFAYNEAYDWLFIASECLGDSALPVGDYFWINPTYGWLVARLGALWNDGTFAGGFCWYLNDASSDSYRGVGGRLLYVPEDEEPSVRNIAKAA